MLWDYQLNKIIDLDQVYSEDNRIVNSKTEAM